MVLHSPSQAACENWDECSQGKCRQDEFLVPYSYKANHGRELRPLYCKARAHPYSVLCAACSIAVLLPCPCPSSRSKLNTSVLPLIFMECLCCVLPAHSHLVSSPGTYQ